MPHRRKDDWKEWKTGWQYKKMHLETLNGEKIVRGYLKKMATAGGCLPPAEQ